MHLTQTEPAATADELRAEMVAKLRTQGSIRSERVAAALLTVPRDHFVPEVDLPAAYARQVVIIKTDAQGQALSSASAPGVVAEMLEQLDVQAGDSVLEIGAGTGWNAALLGHLVGPAGRVVTIEYDPQVADRARAALASAGADNVQVITGDGHLGYQAAAPYQRIIVTAGAFDVDPHWVAQLAPAGRLLVPLRLPWHLTVAFEHAHDKMLRSVSTATAGFIPLAGPSAVGDGSVEIGSPEVLVRLHDPAADPDALKNVLSYEPAEAWSGVVVDDGPSWEHLHLWLIATMPEFCKFNITEDGTKSELLRPLMRWGGLGFHQDGNFAYATNRRASADHPGLSATEHGWEVGIIGHGPHGQELADQVASQISAWNDGPRPAPPPWIELHPAATPDSRLRGRILDRPHHRLAITSVDYR